MKVVGYGIVLIRLSSEDLEMVRLWRNATHINQYMEQTQYISSEQQQNWFKTIDNKFNNYFIIQVQGIKVGLIYGANINWDENFTGNGGIFIGDEKFWETKVPLAAALLLTDTSILMDLEKTFIKILKTNNKAISFNNELGYQIMHGQEKELNQRYCLNQKNYIINRDRIRSKIFKKEEFQKIQVYINEESEVGEFVKKRIEQGKASILNQFEIIFN